MVPSTLAVLQDADIHNNLPRLEVPTAEQLYYSNRGKRVKNDSGIRAFFSNISVPMPFYRRIYLIFRNNLIKIWKKQSCCGHPGEPGC